MAKRMAILALLLGLSSCGLFSGEGLRLIKNPTGHELGEGYFRVHDFRLIEEDSLSIIKGQLLDLHTEEPLSLVYLALKRPNRIDTLYNGANISSDTILALKWIFKDKDTLVVGSSTYRSNYYVLRK